MQPKEITIIGFDDQARSIASNLRNEDFFVRIALPATSSMHAQATHAGFITSTLDDSDWPSKINFLLGSDFDHFSFIDQQQAALPANSTLVFTSGFCVALQSPLLRKDLDIILASPKSYGFGLRQNYLDRIASSVSVAVWQNASGHAWRTATKLAKHMCGNNSRVIYSSFREDCLAKVFAEQVLIGGGVAGIADITLQTLLRAGIRRDLAEAECKALLKHSYEKLEQVGFNELLPNLSEHSQVGGNRAQRYLFDIAFRERVNRLFADIANGQYDLFVSQKGPDRPNTLEGSQI